MMMNLIVILLSFHSLQANPVEMKMPEFSKKVREQGTKEKDPTKGCSVEVNAKNGDVSEMTCGTGDSALVGGRVQRRTEDQTSDYAQDMVRKNRNRR